MNPTTDHNIPERQIAWDGLAFETPADWELSGHQFHRQVGSLVLEDAVDVRLQLEWSAGDASRRRLADIEKRYGVFSRQTDKQAIASRALTGIPEPWLAHHYLMPGNAGMVSGFYLNASLPLVVFARLHERQTAHPQIDVQARRLFTSFQYHAEGLVPWRVYDFDLQIPSFFRLRHASFHAGRKLMMFEYRLRRLFVWQFSLARRLLNNEAPEAFAVRFLQRFKGLPGPRFQLSRQGGIIARPKWWHPFGHYEEIGRQCYRYHAQTLLDMERDRLMILVYHYRKPADLEWIREVRPSARLSDRHAFQNALKTTLG